MSYLQVPQRCTEADIRGVIVMLSKSTSL